MPPLPDVLLPTTMVGSYPRPNWFTYQLLGRDLWEAFKLRHHAEAFEDAVRTVLKDQEEAGLDILTDGQMWFDDYGGGIGSFVWYWYERLAGFSSSKHEHPRSAAGEGTADDRLRWNEWGATAVVGPVGPGPTRLPDLFTIAQRNTSRPIKMCVGAGPVNLGFHVYNKYYRNQRELAYALAPIFNAEMKELVAAGATFLQLEDLGPWLPLNTKNPADFEWIVDVVNQTVAGVEAKIAWHFCYGNNWGNVAPGVYAGGGYRDVLPYLQDATVDQFVLDFAQRNMSDVDALDALAPDKEVAVGVIDIRTTQVETPEQVAERIERVLELVPAERVTLTTDCGMKHLPRFTARAKLKAIVAGARMVRQKLGRGS